MSCTKKEKYVDIIWNPSYKISAEEKIFTKEFLNAYSNAIVFYGVSDDRKGMCLELSDEELYIIYKDLNVVISSDKTNYTVNLYIPVKNSIVVKSQEYWIPVTLSGDFILYKKDGLEYVFTMYYNMKYTYQYFPYSQKKQLKRVYFYLDYN